MSLGSRAGGREATGLLLFQCRIRHMAYTNIQKLRRARATNKGSNRRLAASLRADAAWLDRKGPEELSASEIKLLQSVVKMINLRLKADAYTKAIAEALAEIEKEKRRK